jgi:hypothetical protein
MKLNVRSSTGAGMVQRGDWDSPWLTLQMSHQFVGVGEEAQRGMGGRSIMAIETRQAADGSSNGWVACFSGHQGAAWPGNETEGELMAIASGFYPDRKIVSVSIAR